MKKFVFTLQPLKDVNITKEKQAKQDLSHAEQYVRMINALIRSLEQQFKEQKEAQAKKLADSPDPFMLNQFSNFFEYLLKEIAEKKAELAKAREYRKKCQEKLVSIMKELKMLDNLYQNQYEEYLQEIKKEEEKIIGDLVSYQVVSGQEGRNADEQSQR